MKLTGLQRAGLAGAVLAGLGLAVALAAERWWGVVPCALCLVERWPYRITILLGALSLASPRGARLMVGLSAVVMLGSAGLGFVHVGVEQGLWPSPLPECAAPPMSGLTMAERMARMPAKPAKPCDEPTFLISGLPLSMAAMNMIYSAFLGAGLAACALRRRRTP